MTWLEEHLDEKIAQWATEDGCTADEWRERAIYYVARQRYIGEQAMKKMRWPSAELELGGDR